MDDFTESGFTELNFESALESIFGHVDGANSEPTPSQSQTQGAGVPVSSIPRSGTTYNDALPQTSTQESSVSCPSCEKYKSDLERMDKEYRVNFQFLKKKIINTDLLIRRFKTKQDESELQKKTIDNLGQKLDQAKRDSSILSDQLKSTVESIKPLQEKGTDLESELRKKSLEISDLHTQLAAEKAFGTQRAALDEESRNLYETVNSMKKEIGALKTKKQKWEVRASELEGMLDVLKGENKTGKTKINILAKALYQAQAVIDQQWEILLANGLKIGKGPSVIPPKCKSLIRAAMAAQSLESFSLPTANCDNESDDPDIFQDVSEGDMNEDCLELNDTDDGDHLEDSIGNVKTSTTKKVKATALGALHSGKSETTSQKEGGNISSPEMNSPDFSGISDLDIFDDSDEEKSKDPKTSTFAIGVDEQNKGNQRNQAQENIRSNILDSAGSERLMQGSSKFSPVATNASNVESHIPVVSKSIHAKNNSPKPAHPAKTAEVQERSATCSVKVEGFVNSDLELSDDEDDDVRTIDRCISAADNADSKRKRRKKKASPAAKSPSSGSSETSDLDLSDSLVECGKFDKTAGHKKTHRGITEKFKWNETKSFNKDTKKPNLLKQKTSPAKKGWKTISTVDISESSDVESLSKENDQKDNKDRLFGRNENSSVQNEMKATPNKTALNPYLNKAMNNFLANSDQNISHLSDSEEEEDSHDLEIPFKFLSEAADEGQSLAKAEDQTGPSGVEAYKKEDLSSLLSFSLIENVLSPLAPSPCPSAMSDTQNDDGNMLMPFSLSDSSELESEAGTELASNQFVLNPNNLDGEKTVSGRRGREDKFNKDIIMEETVSFNFCEKDDSVCDKSSSQSDALSSSTMTEGSSHTSTEGSSFASSEDSSFIQEQSSKYSNEITDQSSESSHICQKTLTLTDSSENNTPELISVHDKAKDLMIPISEHVSEKTEELIPVSDSTLEMAQVSDKTREFSHVSDRVEVSNPFSEQTEQLMTVSDKSPVLVKVYDKTLELNFSSDETPELIRASEKIPELTISSEKKSELIRDSDKTSGLITTSEKTPELTRASEKTPELIRASKKTSELIIASDKTPELVPATVKTPELTTATVKTPELTTATVKTPELVTATVKTPELVTATVKTPELVPATAKTPELVTASEKTRKSITASEESEFSQAYDTTPQLTKVSNKTIEKTRILNKNPELTPDILSQTTIQDTKESLPSDLNKTATGIFVPQRELSELVTFTSEKDSIIKEPLSSQEEETVSSLNSKEKAISKVWSPQLNKDCKSFNDNALVPSESILVQGCKQESVSFPWPLQMQEFPKAQGAEIESKLASSSKEDKQIKVSASSSNLENVIPSPHFEITNLSRNIENRSTHGLGKKVEMSPDISEKSETETSSVRQEDHRPIVHVANKSPQVPLLNDRKLDSNVDKTNPLSQHTEKYKSVSEDYKAPVDISTSDVKDKQHKSKSNSDDPIGRRSVPELRKMDDYSDKELPRCQAKLSLNEHQETSSRTKIDPNAVGSEIPLSLLKSSKQLPTDPPQAMTSRSAEATGHSECKPRLVFDGGLSIEELTIELKALVNATVYKGDRTCKSNDYETGEKGMQRHIQSQRDKKVVTNKREDQSLSPMNDEKIQESSQKNSGQFDFNSEKAQIFPWAGVDFRQGSRQEDLSSSIATRETEEGNIVWGIGDVEEPSELMISDSSDDLPLQIDEEESSESLSSQMLEKKVFSINDKEALTQISLSRRTDADRNKQKSTNITTSDFGTPVPTLYHSITHQINERDKLQADVQSTNQNEESSYANATKKSSQTLIPLNGNADKCQNNLPSDIQASKEEIAQLNTCLSDGEIPDSPKESRDELTMEDSSAECAYAGGKNFWELLARMEDFYNVPVLISPLSPSPIDSGEYAAKTTKTLKRSSRKRMSPDKDEVLPSATVKKRLSKPPQGHSQKLKGKRDGTNAMKAKLSRKSSAKEESAAVKKVKLIPFSGFGSVLEAVKCDLRHYLAGDSPCVDETKREMCKRGKDGLASNVWPDVITAVVLQLKDTQEDVLKQMLTAGEGERPPTKVFFSGLESSLLGLLLSFIQHEKDIPVKDLMEALWNAIFDRANLQQCARLSLCRMFSRLCKEQNDEGQLKNLLFNIAWCGYLDFPRCFLSIIGVWPFLATFRPEDAAPSAICLVFEFIFKELKIKNDKFFSQICHILETCCRWKTTSPNTPAEELLKNLVGLLQGDGKEFSPEGFEVMKGIELLLFHMGPDWTQEHFLQRLCVSTVSSWCHSQGKVTPGRVTAVFKIIGTVLAGNPSITENTVKILLGQVFSKAIEKNSRIKELEMAVGEALMSLPKFVTQRCFKLLASWEEHNKDLIPNQVLARLIQFRCAFQQNPTSKNKKKKKKGKNKKGR